MNRKIKKSRAIEYVILCYAAVLMLLFGPLGVLDGTMVLEGTSQTAGQTMPVGTDERIQQVFIGNGGYLEKIGIYAENDLSRKVVNLSVSDDQGEVVFSRNVALDPYQAPGFFVVPVEFQTEPGRGYVWQISHPETEVVLGWQNTVQSGLSCYGNYYYMDAAQQISEQVGQNIPMQFHYADPVSFAHKCGILAGIAAVAAFLILLVENGARKRHSAKEVKVQRVFQAAVNPLILAGAAVWLSAVLFYDYYGGVRADKMVYCAGILIPAALLLYAVNAKRDSIAPLFAGLRTDFADRAMDALQSLFWAGALWGCMDYVNAMYNIYQDYAYRKVLIFVGLAVLTMCSRRYLFHVGNLAWLALSGLAGWYVQRTWPQDAETARLLRLDVLLVMVAGLVLIQLVLLIVKKKVDGRVLSLPYTGLLALFLLLIVVFRNTRGWPIYLAAAFTLVYVFFLSWEGRSRFLGIVCNGIILNFLFALVFAVCRRPFRAEFPVCSGVCGVQKTLPGLVFLQVQFCVPHGDGDGGLSDAGSCSPVREAADAVPQIPEAVHLLAYGPSVRHGGLPSGAHPVKNRVSGGGGHGDRSASVRVPVLLSGGGGVLFQKAGDACAHRPAGLSGDLFCGAADPAAV